MTRSFDMSELIYLIQGLKWTVVLSLLAFVGGGLVGVVIALMRTTSNRYLRGFAIGYIELFRGTPLLMQLFVVHYGLALLGFKINPLLSAIVAFTLNASAFLGDIWRGSIEAVPHGQTEAAKALSLGYWDLMRFVIFAQAARISVPATIGFLVNLVKGTSLASIIGFVDLARSGTVVANLTFSPFFVYGLVGVFYFILCWPLSLLGNRFERHLATGQ